MMENSSQDYEDAKIVTSRRRHVIKNMNYSVRNLLNQTAGSSGFSKVVKKLDK